MSKYVCTTPIVYRSPRYGKVITVETGFVSDGATGAYDIRSIGWWVHDKLCDTYQWDDGSRCSNWQASVVLHDILKAEGRWFRCRSWFVATLIFGEIRKLWR